jgi:hypothetical protein
MKKQLLFFLSLVVLTSSIQRSQERLSTNYPFLRDVEFRCRVAHVAMDGLMSYEYSLHNSVRSNGSIEAIIIDIRRPPNSVSLDTSGLRFTGSGLMERRFRQAYFKKSQEIIPFGLPRLPRYWLMHIGNGTSVSIYTDTLELGPNRELGGFVMSSSGLPTLRAFVAEPFFNIYEFFPSIEDTSSNAMSIAQMDSIRQAVKFHGWTIGPTAPPLNFDASIWIDTLLSYARESVALGWLGTSRDDDCDNDEHPQDGIERNIERRLMLAQRDLQRGDSVKARKDLQMLVNKIDRIWKRGQIEEKKHERNRGDWWQHRKDWVIMTSEAYALLKYNSEYLIDRLPERERHGGKEKVK